jgi:DNA-binding MarR family transcriptional regulator
VKACESKFSRCLYFSSQAFARKVERLAVEHWKPLGLAPSHAYLLVLALEQPGIQPGKMAEQLQLSPSTITRLIEKLEEQKLVIRESVGKESHIHPTARAKALFPQMREVMARFYQAYKTALGEEASMGLIAEMNALTDQL